MLLLRILKSILDHPMNKGASVQALMRFAKWQISSRIAPGAIAYNWINGSRILVHPGETGLTGNVYCGLHEFTDMGFLLHFLRDEDVFIDVGANVGSYTVLACAVVGAHGYAFEPIPTTYSRLVDNVRLNKMEDIVVCINKGVGAEKGELKFTSGRDTMNHAISEGEQEQAVDMISVPVTRLDDELANVSPALMKIDVEGYEWPVLQGADSILDSSSLKCLILETNELGMRYGYDESLIINLLTSKGFQAYSYDPFMRKLTPLKSGSSEKGNTIFIRDHDYVQERLKSAKKYTVLGTQL
ncbi:FkbM family methyltransferase [Cerasicoccus arenae]|uniref:Methyltransferase FkbM domain-containing protein n=1 Tax=Cerasicoccus arenae TaxID=424488 RepID=A0A8J3DKQ6_9BACT|nr:FkbM family methyltransferase [Cerasicoccus arenae]MBK1858655.1 FkbM family methyltransferase [Cerasicoccus arenae]GHC04770.1 hypothetical protein GCM10007047_21990 [Cerasicoccus arenae]